MMQSGGIIRRNANFTIPEAYAKLAIAANPSGYGAAFVNGETLTIGKDSEVLTLELLNGTVEEYPDKDILFYLCNADAGVNKDDISPYSILKAGDDVYLAALVDGNFPGYVKPGSSHPGEFFVANEYLVQKFQSIAEMVGDDVDKIMSMCDKPFFKKELMTQAVSRGTIALISKSGKIIIAHTGDGSAEYPWGWVSSNYGYATTEQPKKEEPVKRSIFSGKSTVREKAATSGAVTENASNVVVPKPTAEQNTVVKSYTKRKWRPPANASRSAKKHLYKNKIGFLPEGWGEGIEIEIYVDENGKDMTAKQVKELGLSVLAMLKLNNPPKEKDTEPEHIPAQTDPDAQKVTVGHLPIMSPDSRAFVKRLIGENSKELPDPNVLKDLETKCTTFNIQLGVKDIREIFPMSLKMIQEIVTKPDAAKTLIWSMQNMLLFDAERAEKKETKTEDVKDAPVKRSIFAKAG